MNIFLVGTGDQPKVRTNENEESGNILTTAESRAKVK